MKNIIPITVMACALAAAPLLAQTGQSAAQAQAQSGSAAAKPAQAAQPGAAKGASPDAAFAREAAIGGMAEVELGNLAKEKAASNDVKQFGDRMVTDHSKANDELKQWAQQKSVTLPAKLDAKHQALRDKLSKLSGDAFDKAYMREMVSDHQHDVAAFRRESTSGKDSDLKAWAGKTLPTLQEHMKLAQDTATKVGVTAGTAAKAKGTAKSPKGSGQGGH
jgi:putative membrane protein